MHAVWAGRCTEHCVDLVGTVPASLSAYLACQTFKPDLIISAGTAGGFRDFTRIAASSPEMWTQIFATNRTELLAALDDIGAETARFRALITAGDWAGVQHYFATARDRREAWDQAWRRRQEGRP